MKQTVSPRHLHVFISSPADVADERALALQVLDRLQYDPLLRGLITIEGVAWDKLCAGAPIVATKTPLEAIKQGLPKPSECDIVVVIFWSRLGTPLSTEYVKPDGSRYLSGTEWEYEDAMRANREAGRPEVIVYRRMDKISVDLEDPRLEQKQEQYKQVNIFFDSFRNPDGSIRQGYNSYKTPEEFRKQLEYDLKSLIARLLKEVPPQQTSVRNDVTEPLLWKGSPFPGLRHFTPDDAPIFFGRGRETDALVNRLRNPNCRFVAIVGASGSGKSSLVGAGLLSRLKTNAIEGSKDWIVVRFTPGQENGDPFMALAKQLNHRLAKNLGDVHMMAAKLIEVVAALSENHHRLDEICTLLLSGEPNWAEIVLFVDQFEELFTLVRKDNYQEYFINFIAALAKVKSVRIVVTLRADFYDRCVEWPQLAELLEIGTFPLAPPQPDALFEMITRPAERAGLEFEENLALRILQDTGSDTGALPLLAYTLDELYKTKQGGQLTWESYNKLGGVRGAIGKRAEDMFTALDPAVQSQFAHVFRNLVTVADQIKVDVTRQHADLSKVASTPTAKQLVDELIEARLLVSDKTTVEVAHEALLSSWNKLDKWIKDRKDDMHLLWQVRFMAKEWEDNNNDPNFLWPDERLKEVDAMIQRLQPELDEVVREFIRPEQERLLKELENPDAAHGRRMEISVRLNEIGDTRPGVRLRSDGLPDIAWCKVPVGKVTLEDGADKFDVAPFYIAKYPITFEQFEVFRKDPQGYHSNEWWQDLTLHEIEPKEQRCKFKNHPRENVRWHEAVAFCRWLTAKYALSHTLLPPVFGTSVENWSIRLPTEWEWQMAATGGNKDNIYPWGKESSGMRANTQESGLNRTTAVGMYPLGASPMGALDMIGNVWEWCLNEYEKPKNIGTAGNAWRAVRGRSFNESIARSAFRRGHDPNYRYDDFFGFRVVYGGVPIINPY